MAVALSPTPRQLFLVPVTGIPAVGWKVFSYQAGTTTKQDTFTTSAGNVANTNPIVLDSLGECDLWMTFGVGYKLVFSPPTDTDPPTHAVWTRDNIFAGDGGITISVFSFATTALLLAAFGSGTILPNGTLATTEGRNAETDGGGGTFYYNSADTTTADNSGTIRVDGANRRWFAVSSTTYNPNLFGAIGSGTPDDLAALTADTTAVLAAETYVSNSFIYTGIYSGPELYALSGNYKISATYQLPARSRWDGQISGNFETRHSARKNGYIHGLRCAGAFRSTLGSWGNVYQQVISNGAFHLDGYDPGFGMFYNTLINCRSASDFYFDANGPMTQNLIIGMTANNFYTTPGVQPVHNNLMIDCEFSYHSGIVSDGVQRNLLINQYFDGGSENIVGDYDVIGLVMGSAQGHPTVTRDNWIICNSDVNSLTDVDYIPLSTRNLTRGNWDWLNTSGWPISWTGTGGVGLHTNSDEPTGVGMGLGFVGITVADNEIIVPVDIIPQTGSIRVSAIFFGTLTTTFLRTNADPATDVFASPVNFTAYGTGWNRVTFNFPFNAGAAASLALHFVVSGTVPSPKSLYVSSVQMGCEKALPAPFAITDIVNYGIATSGGYCLDTKGVRHQFGKVTQSNVAAPTTIDVAITFPKVFAATPASVSVTLEATGADSANMTKVWVKTGTLNTTGMTVTITYATAYQGIIHWQAIGFST